MSAAGRKPEYEERFVRGGGPGGQKVNKTSSTVVLRDPATGIEVRCDTERSQSRNRALARALLQKKVTEQRRQQAAREKERRRRRQKSRAQKAKMLEEKRKHGAQKALRRRVEAER